MHRELLGTLGVLLLFWYGVIPAVLAAFEAVAGIGRKRP
jgi:hypothetical protein